MLLSAKPRAYWMPPCTRIRHGRVHPALSPAAASRRRRPRRTRWCAVARRTLRGVGDQRRGQLRAVGRAECERAVRLQDDRGVRVADGAGEPVDPRLVARLLGRRGQPLAGVLLPRHHPEHRHLHQRRGVAGLRSSRRTPGPRGDLGVRDPGAEPLGLGAQRDLAEQLLAAAGRVRVGLPRLVALALVDAPRPSRERVVGRAPRDGGYGVRRVGRGRSRGGQGGSAERSRPRGSHRRAGVRGGGCRVRVSGERDDPGSSAGETEHEARPVPPRG